MTDLQRADWEKQVALHWSRYGTGSLYVRKIGRGWHLDLLGESHPSVFKTKKAAIEAGDAWMWAIVDRKITAELAAKGIARYDKYAEEAQAHRLESILSDDPTPVR